MSLHPSWMLEPCITWGTLSTKPMSQVCFQALWYIMHIEDGNVDGIYIYIYIYIYNIYREPHSCMCTPSICLLNCFCRLPQGQFQWVQRILFYHAIHDHIVAASMQILGMTYVHASPTIYVLPDDMTTLTKAQKRGLLLTPAGDILSAFFCLHFK